MEPAVYRSIARRRDSRHGTAITPFSGWQGGACAWRVGVLKSDGSLDDLYGVSALVLRISSYGGTSPGAFSWIARTVPAADFATPTSAAAVQAGAEWHAEVQLTEEETLLPVDDSGTRPYWWEWRAVTAAGEVPLSAGQLVIKGASGRAGTYALTSDVSAEADARGAAISTAVTAEAEARTAAIAAETTAREAAVTTLTGQTDTLTSGQATLTGKVTTLETAVPGKANVDLVNALAEAVTSRLLGTGSVTPEKLAESVKASMGNGLDPAKNRGNWNAATNTPVIPTAAGHTGEHYYVVTPGTPTGNAAGVGACDAGDTIYSDGTSWIRRPAPPTVIPPGTLPITALTNFEVATNLTVTYKGQPRVLVFAVLVSNKTKCLVGWTFEGQQIPDPAEAVAAGLAPLLPFAAPGGIPPQNVSGWTIKTDGVWIMDGDDRVYLPLAVVDQTGGKVMFGVALDGARYPKAGTSNYNPPGYSVYPQDGGGVAMADNDGEKPVIVEAAAWKGIQPTSEEDVWIGSSNRLGAPRLFRFNVLKRAVAPAKSDLLLHFGGTGQSLMAGGNGGPVILSDTAIYPDDNLMFNGGLGAGLGSFVFSPGNATSFVPMVQTPWAGRTYETLMPAFMNRLNRRLSALLGRRVRIICSNHASGGKAYADIKEGTQPFANGVYEVMRAKALAAARGWEYLYAGTLFAHGEQNRVIGTSAEVYEANIKQLLADETTAYKAITGQLFDHLLFLCGMHSWTAYNFTTPTTTLGQLAAALSSIRVKMVGPKYVIPYSDGIHSTNYGYRLLGERYAEAVFCEMFGPGNWKAFAPVEIGQTSDTVWARMQTPQGHSMAFDTSLVTDPGRYGFELVGGFISGTPYLDGNRVVIPKTGNPTRLRYAYTGTALAAAGPTTGARGCLRDLYPQVSDYDGSPLHNYCNTFDMAVPLPA